MCIYISLPCQLSEPRKNITTVAMSLSTIQILAFNTILQDGEGKEREEREVLGEKLNSMNGAGNTQVWSTW